MPEYDLTPASQPSHAARLSRRVFQANLLDYQVAGQGFYGAVYRAVLDRAPGMVIFKWYKHSGSAAREARNLEIIRRHSLLKVPGVYHIHTASDEIPFEVLLMEHLPGVTAAEVSFTDPAARAAFIESLVTNLQALHAVSHPSGFGDLDGPFYPAWPVYFRTRIEREIQAVRPLYVSPGFPSRFHDLIETAYACFDRILAGSNSRSSLVHSDYNLWNVLVDPLTCRVTGIIDPMSVCWADRELDLFQLYNGPGAQLGLLERYLRAQPVDAEFFLRSSFYRFWDDVHHYNALPGPLRPVILEGLEGYMDRLEAEMLRHLS